jgi:hypothetical protein
VKKFQKKTFIITSRTSSSSPFPTALGPQLLPTMTTFYLVHVLKAVHEVLRYLVMSFFRPVSYPGNPIAKPLTRRGKWSRAPVAASSGWKFASAEESHKVSGKMYPGVALTGPPAGRQMWYQDDDLRKPTTVAGPLFSASGNPNSGDKLFRSIMISRWKGPVPDTKTAPTTARDAAKKALSFYQMLQCDDGHWAGDYGGPMFLMPGLITCLYITKAPFPQWKKDGMIAYLKNHQQDDGGWGTHIECARYVVIHWGNTPPSFFDRNSYILHDGFSFFSFTRTAISTMFGTVLSYVSLRLLGEPAEAPYMSAARQFILKHGGALYAPSWCKVRPRHAPVLKLWSPYRPSTFTYPSLDQQFWLAVLGVYDWAGTNSIPAEMWYLPRWFPFHPGKLWCHCRMVYLPMCYVYCKRFVPDVEKDETLKSLRKELYTQEYSTIDWDGHRQVCADIDEYSPLNPVMKIAQDFLAVYERVLPYIPPLKWLRNIALGFVIDYIHEEDEQTNYVDIGPVNKALNMLSVWIDAGQNNADARFLKHLPRVDDYLWVAEDGMKMQGYNGSQCWDTSFAIQAVVEGNLVQEFPECSRKVYDFLKNTQIADDETQRVLYYRHVSKGGWPFSTAAHGWPISDCTAEGLKGVLALHKSLKIAPEDMISADRLKDACNVILSLHNADGGWATYENNRGYGWYEMLNPSEVFGDIMIDYSYVECTSACMTALKAFAEVFPEHRASEVANAIQAGRRFIKSIQRADGSWYGSWAVCFTYGTWFGIEALVAAGESPQSPAVQNAMKFLLGKQNANGGWGESYVACVNKSYPDDGTGHQVCSPSPPPQRRSPRSFMFLIFASCSSAPTTAASCRQHGRCWGCWPVNVTTKRPFIVGHASSWGSSCPTATGTKKESPGFSIARAVSRTPPTATFSRCGHWYVTRIVLSRNKFINSSLFRQ